MEYGLISAKKINSFSSLIHQQVANLKYDLLNMNEDNLIAFIKHKDFKGINITIPYKEVVIPLLDEIDPLAASIGAVNTIVNVNNRLIGYNTDYFGFSFLLRYHSIKVVNKRIMILGSGGSSKCINKLLNDLNAKEVITVSRIKTSNTISYDEIKHYTNINIIINTTPIGMSPNINETLINLDLFSNLEAVIDIVYNPLNTKLLLDAKSRKIKTYGGLIMLVAQAYKADELFLNTKLDEEIIISIYKQFLKQLTSITLIGLPYSGKSTLAQHLSNLLDKKVIDTDQLITKLEEQEIAKIFKTKGESYFRQVENKVIKEISLDHNQVIATGGGSILLQENIEYLKANSIIIFVNRPLSLVKLDQTRPLALTVDDLKQRFSERIELYKKYADFEVINDQEITRVVNQIKECYDEYFID